MHWIQMDRAGQLSLQQVTQVRQYGSVLFVMKIIMKKILKIGYSVDVERGLMNYS